MTVPDADQDDLLPLLLEVCEELISHGGPATHEEIDQRIRAHGFTGGPGWLVSMLAFTRHRLHLVTPRIRLRGPAG